MTIKTENQCHEAADQYANKAIAINELKAKFATESNDLKKREKAALLELTKEANSFKTKIRNFVKKNAMKIFGKESGSFKTQQAEIKLRNNPAKIKQIDNSMNEEDLIGRAKELGLRSVIIEKEFISKEALERLSNEELEVLGYYRATSQSFDIIPLAEPKAKITTKTA